VGLDAQHRTLVSLHRNLALPVAFSIHKKKFMEEMGRGILLWQLGVPIPVIILLWLFFGH
jgi:hypothetical protein